MDESALRKTSMSYDRIISEEMNCTATKPRYFADVDICFAVWDMRTWRMRIALSIRNPGCWGAIEMRGECGI